MALLLDAVYRPFKAFFLEKFGAAGGAAPHFRFAAVPHAFTGADFMLAQHPEWGASPAVARERTSRVVDGVPTLELDGRRVTIGPAAISDLYADELLAPAVAAPSDDPTAQARVDAFNRAKADARKLYEASRVASVAGEGELVLTQATPERWWDASDGAAWTHQSFQIVGAAAVPAKPAVTDTFLGMFRRGKRAAQAAVTNVVISFDFCLVRLERRWLHRAFLDDRSWFVPGRGRGSLSSNDGHGVPALPLGFVAIKDLRIEAPWTPEDVSALEESVQFGPFNFDSRVVDGAIRHAGIQIVGWLLEDVGDLPPLSDPAAQRAPVARPAREVLGYLDVHRGELARGLIDGRALVEHAFLDGPVPSDWWAQSAAGLQPLGPRTQLAPDVAEAALARGRRWLEEGDARGTEAIARALLLLVPPDAPTNTLLGDALAKQGRDDQARAAYDEALRRAPRDVAALAARGELLLTIDLHAALADLKAASDLDRGHTDPHAERARALIGATANLLRQVTEEKRAKEAPPAPVAPAPKPALPAVVRAPSRPGVATLPHGESLARFLASTRPVLVEFAARWAGPSRLLSPLIDALAAEFSGRVDVVRVDVDASPTVVAQYGVSAVPTVILFQRGAVVDQLVGAVQRARLVALFERATAPTPVALAQPPALMLQGRWSSGLGSLVFVPQGLGYRYDEWNLLGLVVGSGVALVQSTLVQLEGVNALVGAYRAQLQLGGNQLAGFLVTSFGQMPLTLSRT